MVDMPLTTKTRSMLLLLLTMTVWGSTFVVTKDLVALWPPFTLALVRVGLGTLVLLPMAFSRHRRGDRLPWSTMWLMGLVGVALYYLTFNLAMVYVSASQGALVQASIPAMTALVAVLWLRERASAMRWLGIALSVGGILIVFSGSVGNGGGEAPMLGNFLMFSSVVCWAFYTSLAKRVAGFDSMVVTTAVMGTGTLLLVPLAGYEIVAAGDGLTPLPLRAWLGILYLGAMASGLAYVLYNASLRHLDASAVGVYTNLIPVVGVLTGVIVLGEPLSGRAVLGGLVVMLGVWITSRSERPVAAIA
ncbi:EamA family transporter [Steroidobacter sp. S1-65]|uniref:EamA family transporter n=1 Tax=Steroidobacter gossypii TaxID=2805490 RepID=A0ABS1X577_9GAMM|nr:EamA family transporter [Steroidobacter gossypii]MBM0108380.1 EamA family transporter [Steroidobacter gossypii]